MRKLFSYMDHLNCCCVIKAVNWMLIVLMTVCICLVHLCDVRCINAQPGLPFLMMCHFLVWFTCVCVVCQVFYYILFESSNTCVLQSLLVFMLMFSSQLFCYIHIYRHFFFWFFFRPWKYTMKQFNLEFCEIV